MKQYYLLYCIDLYNLRSGIQLPLNCYITVADRLTRTEITYIQVTLLLYLKLRDVFRVSQYISRRNRVCILIFSMLTFDFVCCTSQGSKKLYFVEMWGGGGGAL